MDPRAKSIADRLSLRAPQRDSLKLLDRLCAAVPLVKGQDLDRALAAARQVCSGLESFDREFPSYAFALATGVGKTRLMGAFIAYLARVHRLRHFFVLAPNLTIYRKLIADFTPGTPKYVFQGLAELATHPPLLVTGDDYEDGRGVRDDAVIQRRIAFDASSSDGIHVNVFNIAKITEGERKTGVARIRRLSECIGESYFDYLSKLEDLVLVMDESHRYRADAGARAVNELRPVLGLELTATPQVERGGRSEPFCNVAFSYPLARAIAEGFVKEPAVATRQDFDAEAVSPDALERIKLEDGVRIHETTKAELEVYARERGVPPVKPFVLVIARDTEHAKELQEHLESLAFFDGRYRGRVIQVHSKQSGDEKDEVVEKLLTVERADNPTEIVVHVNMLKEGWDVTNLYTIVPLRAASSRNLVEQSIGRGLRLPYGVRTGVSAVDTLTIVAHDKFQEIVDYARDPSSVLRHGIKEVVLTDPETAEPVRAVASHPVMAAAIDVGTTAERRLKQAAFEAVRELARGTGSLRLSTARDLELPEVRRAIVARVREQIAATASEQLDLYAVDDSVLDSAVAEVAAAWVEHTIDVPRIVVVPRGEVTSGFRDFDLAPSSARFQPVAADILIQDLQSEDRRLIRSQVAGPAEARVEDYIVRALVDYDDVSYDDHASLLYKLAGQMLAHLRSYLVSEEDVLNVVQSQHARLAELIHAQMVEHFSESVDAYDWEVRSGISPLPERAFTQHGERRDYRRPPPMLGQIGRYVFEGFAKSCYPEEKFASDPERRFAVILEQDPTVVAWLRPAPGLLYIHAADGSEYRPDFVVETNNEKLLCEIKATNQVESQEVREKARLAGEWCARATAAAPTKAWRACLIPETEVEENRTVSSLAAAFAILAR